MEGPPWQDINMVMFPFNGKKYFINDLLKDQLNSLCYNIKNDWDFIILITGDRTVRTGKSVLAMTIGAYLSYTLNRIGLKNTFTLNNLYFDSRKMISDALNYPKHSVIIYDEGREALSTSKSFTDAQKDIMDYFAECGQLNHIFIIVLPDFFGLVEEMAIARSEILLNVYRHETIIKTDMFKNGERIPIVRFDRGRLQFFNRYGKQKLFDKARRLRMKSYSISKPNLPPLNFTNQYPLDEIEYKKKKRDWLIRFKERKNNTQKAKPTDVIRDTIIRDLHNDGKTSLEISQYLEKEFDYNITDRGVRLIVNRVLKKSKVGDPLPLEGNAE